MTKLIFVRHGESESNESNRFAGSTDVALTKLGHTQAKRTAKYIFENYKIDKIYASDLQRAYITAGYIAKLFGLDVNKDKNLREIEGGKWEAESYDVIERECGQDYDLWRKNIGLAACTDGESVVEMLKRVLGAVEKIALENDGKTVVIVSHGTPIRAMQCIFKGMTLDNMKDIEWASNASVSEVFYNNGEYEPIKINYDDHLWDIKTKLPPNA